jgi:hypothetical protein
MSAFLAPARPRTVTITLWGVFLLGTWNAGRALAVGWRSELLLEIGVQPDPRWRLMVALLWSLIFWGAALALWRNQPIARLVIPVLLFFYALSEFGFLLFLSQSTLAKRAWLMYTVFHLGTILFSWWTLNRSAVRFYFNQR